ncbi:MAG: FtsX-like permease family protein [Acidobacteriota bacterium]|nr:FtsX-like permease family protein [Acidobacteriota bacterium]
MGWSLGFILLVAAALTTSSVLRLIAQLHREEITIMRLVGATEFYIRGPFYLEGLLQGIAGATLAILALMIGFRALPFAQSDPLWVELFLAEPAGPIEIGALLVGGALVGLLGAVLSLRREASPGT